MRRDEHLRFHLLRCQYDALQAQHYVLRRAFERGERMDLAGYRASLREFARAFKLLRVKTRSRPAY